jgi:hypothetical protein
VLEARVDRVRRTATVQEDWQAWLPEAKDHLFAFTNKELEASYVVLSVTLDDAFTFCQRGMFLPARDQAAVFGDLFERVSGCLRGVLRALCEHGRDFGTLPNVAPLRPGFFRSERAQQIARTNNLFSFLVLRSRKRFFRKLGAVEQIVADLHLEARGLTGKIAQADGLHISKQWKRLEILHYDLNTCLCETTIMLKSFFCVLPIDELTEFRKRLLPVPAAARGMALPEPLFTNTKRAASGRQMPVYRAGGIQFPEVPRLQPQSYHPRDNSGSGDSISTSRMHPDGTSGPNETI